jgi:tRNA A37 threonylcarbamoyladenosine dehydratase
VGTAGALESVAAAEAASQAGAADTRVPPEVADPDLERRFGGLRRLYGDAGYGRLRAARVAVVGVGGVGSWAAEALARSGVAALTLVDLDHVSESNINRQVQAVGATLGMAKVDALAARLADIHPGCQVTTIDDFATPDNWPALLPAPVDAVIDACDQSSAKLALARWALGSAASLVVCGAAGGKRLPQAVAVEDLTAVTHDPLLAALRSRLRKAGFGGDGGRGFGLACVFSREAVRRPEAAFCETDDPGAVGFDGSLNCAGYGSSVTVTASFGLAAAAAVIEHLVDGRPQRTPRV